VVAVGEASDVTDFHQEPSCAGGSDAVQVEEPGAGRSDQQLEFLVGVLAAA
jgi:hypothetical protein